MSKLEDLYKSIQTLKELGVRLDEKLLEETSRVEEEIIKKDIIPILAETINPLIQQIQREIILVVEYTPDEPVSVRWSRKRNLSELSPEFSNENKKNNYSEREPFTISPHTKASKTTLQVTFPDGRTITHRFAYETLVHTIRTVGYEKVQALNMKIYGVPLVSTTRDDFYTQHELKTGVLILTHSSTKIKKEQLEEISKKLGLNLKVEIV